MSVKRKQFTREEKLEWVEKLKTSGLSLAAFVASVTPDGPTEGPLRKWRCGEALGGGSSGERKMNLRITMGGVLAILDTASVAEDIGVMRAMLAAARHLLNGIVL